MRYSEQSEIRAFAISECLSVLTTHLHLLDMLYKKQTSSFYHCQNHYLKVTYTTFSVQTFFLFDLIGRNHGKECAILWIGCYSPVLHINKFVWFKMVIFFAYVGYVNFSIAFRPIFFSNYSDCFITVVKNLPPPMSLQTNFRACPHPKNNIQTLIMCVWLTA